MKSARHKKIGVIAHLPWIQALACTALLAFGASACSKNDPATQPGVEQPGTGDVGNGAPADPVATEPDEPVNEPAEPITKEVCEKDGGTFVASIGGEPTCPEGQRVMAQVKHGIEGGVCCK